MRSGGAQQPKMIAGCAAGAPLQGEDAELQATGQSQRGIAIRAGKPLQRERRFTATVTGQPRERDRRFSQIMHVAGKPLQRERRSLAGGPLLRTLISGRAATH